MSYPKVKDFLSHVVTGTKVSIKDDAIGYHVRFEGTIGEYMDSFASSENLTLMQSYIKDNTLHIMALKDYKKEETIFKDKSIICPHCNFVYEESLDYIETGDMEGEFPMECEQCEKEIKVEFNAVITFTSSK